ncbi:MAG TPA: NUDIX domain-containing protein [Thermomicrobiales bacterium]|nr:NUDIX domain-containing protein [Thermomicrobiales bacterium]
MPDRAEAADHARELERRFFAEAGRRRSIRVAVRALIILDGHILLQRLAYTGSVWFFPGGELEFGESLGAGLRRELNEELSLDVDRVIYRLAANNRFEREGVRFHLLEHYFEVTPVSTDIESLESSVLVEWHALNSLHMLDVRPVDVRDILDLPDWRDVRSLESE